MTERMILGTGDLRPGIDEDTTVNVDLEKLVGQHLCIMSMSGGGKSGAIRKLLEVTHGQIQQIVIDPEDEFYTLRESFDDYLIAGGEGGDCPATVRNAAELATMLLTTGMNAVIQLNDLSADDQQIFVALFLGAMMSAPRDLWHPALIVLDETHRFVPQEGEAASSGAVRELTSRGRKRGFTAVLATQRMAKINKNVTGDVTNWLIGRVGQGTDRRVAADQLGFSASSSEAKELQTMLPRHFWAFGPAFSVPPRMFRVADTATTIVKAGQARLPTPPAPEAMREIMAAMAEAAKPPPAPESAPHSAKSTDPDAVSLERFREACDAQFQDGLMRGWLNGARDTLNDIQKWATGRLADIGEEPRPAPINTDLIARQPQYVERLVADMVKEVRPVVVRPEGMMTATKKILALYEKFWPRSLPFLKAAQLAGVGLKSSQFKLYEPDLVASGMVEAHGDGYRAKAGDGSGPAEIVAAYVAQLSPAFKKIWWVIVNGGQIGRSREDIVHLAEISPTSSTTTAALSQMMKDEFVEKIDDRYRIVEMFR